MNVVDIENVRLCRSDKTILEDISWTIRRGEHCALLGANGSGKTTLLKVLTGYEWPTQGSVSVLGKRYGACDVRALRKTIGWVSSALEHRVPRNDTALEIVGSGFDSSFGLYRELDAEEIAQCRVALELLEGRGFESQRYATLSQGERKRTLIARALVNGPALLVLDEPCAGLDPVSRTNFLEGLTGFVASPQSPTIVLVTHHVEEIGPWIEMALVLKNGRVISKGRIDEVVTTAVMSEAYSRPCQIDSNDGFYRLSLPD